MTTDKLLCLNAAPFCPLSFLGRGDRMCHRLTPASDHNTECVMATNKLLSLNAAPFCPLSFLGKGLG
ncbi:Uncharacterised protein [Serratia fonticola]|nr:Uncharacterised protein [Serratia fonticola]